MNCWEIEIFKNQKLALNFLCSSEKKGVMKIPMMDSFGHSFCKICLENLINQKKKCPESDHDFRIKNPVKNLLAMKIIDKLEVKCTNFKKECDWEGKLINLKQHLKTNCFFEEIDCTNTECRVKIPRKELKSHLENCEFKKIDCKFCKNLIIIKELQNHEKFCPKILIKCKKCNLKIRRDDVDNHIKNICKMSETSCPYIDCQIGGSRKEVRDHVFSKNGLLPHQNMLSERIKKIEDNFDLIENFMDRYSLKFENLKTFRENEKKSEGFFSPDFHHKSIIVDRNFRKLIKVDAIGYGFCLMKEKIIENKSYKFKLFCQREIGIGIADPSILKKNHYLFHDNPIIENCFLFKIKPMTSEIGNMNVEIFFDKLNNCLVFTNFNNDGKTSLNLGSNDISELNICFILLDEGDNVEILLEEPSDFFDE